MGTHRKSSTRNSRSVGLSVRTSMGGVHKHTKSQINITKQVKNNSYYLATLGYVPQPQRERRSTKLAMDKLASSMTNLSVKPSLGNLMTEMRL